MQDRVKKVMDLMLKKSLESNGFTDLKIDMTSIQDNDREVEIILNVDNRKVKVQMYLEEELPSSVIIEMDHCNHFRDLEDLEQVLNNLDKFENPSKEKVEEMKAKWLEENNKRLEEEFFGE